MVDKLNKKVYKQMKREVVESSAIQVGYFETIMQAIPNYAMIESVRRLSEYGWITPNKNDTEVENMLVTEAIKVMNYQDFKDVAPHLFSFNPYRQQSDVPIVETVHITRENYEAMQSQIVSLLSFQEAVMKQQNSVSSKIKSLEMTKVETGEKVIGVNTDTEELILLRTPEKAYIDDWEVSRENLITDYRNTESNEIQTVRYLDDNYSEISLKLYEYVMDNDLYNGFADTPKEILEESIDIVPDFKTHEEFYTFASQYDVFNETYPTYDTYIVDRYQFLYTYSSEEYISYASDFLRDNMDFVEAVLEQDNKELVIQEVRGYSQGDYWELSYIRDKAVETREQVEYYLEHEIGAWYRGSLTEFVVIPFKEITPEGYTGLYESRYLVDEEELWVGNTLDKIKALYPEFKDFKAPKEIKQNQVKEMDKGSKSL